MVAGSAAGLVAGVVGLVVKVGGLVTVPKLLFWWFVYKKVLYVPQNT